jgi:CheY-like chemotaxis protein
MLQIDRRADLGDYLAFGWHPSDAGRSDDGTAHGRVQALIAALCHEIRNPLAPIRHSALLLRKLCVGDADARQREALDMIDRQVRHLSTLLDDLVGFYRDRWVPDRSNHPVRSLTSIILAAVDKVAPLMRLRDLRIELGELVSLTVQDDGERLSLAIRRLLEWSAEHAGQKGHVSIGVRAESNQAVIHLRLASAPMDKPPLASDLGSERLDAGTPELAKLPRANGTYGVTLASRGPKYTLAQRKTVLLGIGRLLDLPEGNFQSVSGEDDEGHEFVIRLPAIPEKNAPKLPEQAPESEEVSQPSNKPWRILIVDDNEDSAQSLAMILELDGHQVAIACDGPDALAQAKRFLPQMALLDIGLPGMDGVELARRLRAAPELRNLFLVALTGYGRPEDVARSLAAGFDEHWIKPADPTRIEDLLRRNTPPEVPAAQDPQPLDRS